MLKKRLMIQTQIRTYKVKKQILYKYIDQGDKITPANI